jgi:hypothetical protein
LWKTKINPEWWIAHATRWYFDIKKINANEKNVSEYTLLNHINDGTWMWQIPLYKSSILSVWIISLKKTLIKWDYEKLVLKYKHPFYSEISLKRWTGELERIRTRQGFSESSTISSWKNFILVWDAYSFTDPVFSIWTWTAVSEAVYVANSLNNWVFNPKEYDEKCKKVNASFLTSFKFWYNDDWKKKYNLSLIQKNTLQWNTLIENFHHFDSTLSSYIWLVTGMEWLYEWNHQNIKHFKNIIVYFAEENYNFNNSILLLWYFWLNSSKYIEIKEEEVINFFISIKWKLLDTKTVIKLSMKYNISIQQKIIYYFKSLIIKKIIPTYKKP